MSDKLKMSYGQANGCVDLVLLSQSTRYRLIDLSTFYGFTCQSAPDMNPASQIMKTDPNNRFGSRESYFQQRKEDSRSFGYLS